MSMGITFLTREQIWGDKALQVIKSYGRIAGVSDLAVVLGGCISGGNVTRDGQRSGDFWSASSDGERRYLVHICTAEGENKVLSSYYRNIASARPVLPVAVTSSITPGEVRHTRNIGDVQVVEYGEYPQTIAAGNIGRELQYGLGGGRLHATGKRYTFDCEALNAYDKPFRARECAEYLYNGKKYIRVMADRSWSLPALSNDRKPQAGEACWIEVQPIEWLKDPSGVWVARQALFSGVQFDRKDSYGGNFADTDMKRYLDHYFSKDMMPSRTVDVPVVVGPRTAAVVDGREAQRRRALEDPSQGL